MNEINKLQSGCGFVQYQTPISAGGTTFSSNFEKGGSEKKRVPGRSQKVPTTDIWLGGLFFLSKKAL